MPKSLADQARARSRAPVRFDINNELAADIVQQLSETMTNAFQMIAQVMQDQNAMLRQVVQSSGNAEVLRAIDKQTELLTKLVQRPVKVEAGGVEVTMPPQATRFEFELDSNGDPIALVAMED